MGVYEIAVGAVDDAAKERVARMLCPDEHHPPPCQVPWSFTADDGGVVLAVVADRATAAEVASRVSTITGRAAPVAVADPADHEDLVVQARIESDR